MDFFLSKSQRKEYQRKHIRIGTGEADKFYQVNFTTCWLRSWHQRGLETFVNIDISSNEYMKQTKESLKPVYSDGFTGIDGKYRIVITYPITSVDDGII